jgi:hypothetical protein
VHIYALSCALHILVFVVLTSAKIELVSAIEQNLVLGSLGVGPSQWDPIRCYSPSVSVLTHHRKLTICKMTTLAPVTLLERDNSVGKVRH